MVEPFNRKHPKHSITCKETWIRLVGIPLHLWPQKVLQEIGEVRGGWIATEEETELKDHMKWARILMAPKEVSIEWNRITDYFQIWIECKPCFK